MRDSEIEVDRAFDCGAFWNWALQSVNLGVCSNWSRYGVYAFIMTVIGLATQFAVTCGSRDHFPFFSFLISLKLILFFFPRNFRKTQDITPTHPCLCVCVLFVCLIYLSGLKWRKRNERGFFFFLQGWLCVYVRAHIGLSFYAPASSLTSYLNHIWKGSAGRAGDHEKLRST